LPVKNISRVLVLTESPLSVWIVGRNRYRGR
jgi:hypothetical protein